MDFPIDQSAETAFNFSAVADTASSNQKRRNFSNRRQVASYAGLAPMPWRSGSVARERGVSKAGNPRLRTTMIQLSWLWIRHQPRSILTLWFHHRVQLNGGRVRKVLIVALARKLLIAFWISPYY
jgi:transposase